MNNLTPIFGGFVILACLVFAYFLIFTKIMTQEEGIAVIGTRRTILVVILIGYAIFRSFRLYKTMTKNKNDE